MGLDIKKEILSSNFKEQAAYISQYIIENPDHFSTLMDLFFSSDTFTCQRSSWVMAHCIDKEISLIEPYLHKMVKNLSKPVSDATKRNTVRMLEKVEIPEPLWEDCLNHCFGYLESNEEPIAVKVFSMTVLYNLSLKIPEIKNELIMLIEDMLPYGSAGLKSRGKKILNLLKNG
jgi:hypothetical protein